LNVEVKKGLLADKRELVNRKKPKSDNIMELLPFLLGQGKGSF
jgi:hypothetical protein